MNDLPATDAARWAWEVGASANVLAVVPDEGDPLERAVAAWSGAAGSSRTYVVHDADFVGGGRLPVGRPV